LCVLRTIIKTAQVDGEATVYVQLGAFHKPTVKCYMDMMFEVDIMLDESFMDKYNCILHYMVVDAL
jgi:hypothetical protein